VKLSATQLKIIEGHYQRLGWSPTKLAYRASLTPRTVLKLLRGEEVAPETTLKVVDTLQIPHVKFYGKLSGATAE